MQENQVTEDNLHFSRPGCYRIIPLAVFVFGIVSHVLMAKPMTQQRQFTVRLPSERDLAGPEDHSSGGQNHRNFGKA